MTITSSYNDALGKVTVSVASAPSNASSVKIERQTSGFTWTTVRGAASVALSGGAASVDDYEYAAGGLNTYRASYISTAPVSYVSSVTSSSFAASAGSSVSTTPAALSGSPQIGDLIFAFAGVNKAGGSVATATSGWTVIEHGYGPVALYAAQWSATLAMPMFTATGIASGDVLSVNVFDYRNATLGSIVAQLNASAQNINTPAMAVPASLPAVGFVCAYKMATQTSVAATPTTLTFGSGGSGWLNGQWQSLIGSFAASFFAVSGGTAAVSKADVGYVVQAAYVLQETSSVTPVQTAVWLKNPTRPFLNRTVTVVNVDSVTLAARSGVFTVVGRNTPIIISDARQTRSTSITVRCGNEATVQDLIGTLYPSDVVFLHPPLGQNRVPRMYASVGDIVESFPNQSGTVRYLALPLTEVAAPAASQLATIGSYQTVINTYATYAAVLTAKASYAALLQVVGSVADVVTS